MKLDRNSLKLYAVTDRNLIHENKLEGMVEAAIKGGATFIQLREKELDDIAFWVESLKIKAITDKYNVPFVINDNVEVAIKSDADGIHIGQSDMNAKAVRKLIGSDKILGVSAQTVEQALKAQADGADYIGVGAVFSTSSKGDADSVSIETLTEICNSVKIPVVAIGGINKGNIMLLKGSGICGVAVISAIFAQADIYNATQKLLAATNEI